jgi:hypothetical protein
MAAFAQLVGSSFALLALVLIAAFGVGAPLTHLLGWRDRARPEFYIFATALGLGSLGHLALGLGALGLLRPRFAWMLLALAALLALLEIRRQRAAYRAALASLRLIARPGWFAAALLSIIALGCLYPLLADALVPPAAWDEVAYHLAIPKLYIAHGGIRYIPFIPYSNWPLETEMLSMLGLLLGSDILAHLVSWLALLLLCVAVWAAGRRAFGGAAGLAAAALVATAPMTGALAGVGLVEVPLALFTFLAIAAFLLWLDDGAQANWLLSAIFAGLAASTKMNAAVLAAILGTLVGGIALVGRRTSAWRAAGLFASYGLVGFLVVAPWYTKTWLLTGNPFWPFFQEWLGARDWDQLGSQYLFGYIRITNTPLDPANWLLNMWRATTTTHPFGPPQMNVGWLFRPLILLAVPALFLLPAPERRMARWFAALWLIFYTSWFLQTHQTRFLMPILPLLALLGAGGAYWLWHIRAGAWRVAVQAGLVAGLAASLWAVRPDDRARLATRWPYLSGAQDRQEFLASTVPGYKIYAYANAALPQNARVLLALNESRGYYLDRDYAWANPISQRALRLEQYDTPEELADDLLLRGFTHIIFTTKNPGRYNNLPYGQKFTATMNGVLDRHARKLFADQELILYELLS